MAEMKFEQALAKLEELVEKLEHGDLGLDESLASFEQGMKLVKLCAERLKEAEKRVQKLVEAEGGQVRLEPFEGDADSEADA